MPPRKRARLNNSTRRSVEVVSEAPEAQDKEESESQSTEESPNFIPEKFARYGDALASIQFDPWTDEEETLLFKGLVRWKPTGVHKHFRMLSIFEHFRSHGFGSGYRDPPAHLRIPGIWAKLYTIYDLDALNHRENEYAGIVTPEDADEEDKGDTGDDEGDENEPGKEKDADFKLPDDLENPHLDFGPLMWSRRFETGADSSFTGPELVKGLSHTRSLPGVELVGNGDDEESDEGNEAGSEDDEEEDGSDDEEAEVEEDEVAEEEDEDDSVEEDEVDEEEEKAPKKGAKSKVVNPKTAKSIKPAPKRRLTRGR